MIFFFLVSFITVSLYLILIMIKTRRKRQAEHKAQTGKIRNAHTTCIIKHQIKRFLYGGKGGRGAIGRIILEGILEKCNIRIWTRFN
jgi:hypothetical protein